MDAFYDREVELRALQASWEAPGASLVLVWGRRRTGKTRLLGRFAEDKPAIFHGATEQSSVVELSTLSEAVRRSMPPSSGDLLAHSDFPTWDVALTYLGELARHRKLVVILDEFPYLVQAEPALPSMIQRFWDHQSKRSKLKLVLCGSAQAVMEQLQAERAPLFGRVDVRLQVRPFRYDEAALFLPRLSPAERAIAYGVLGGMPTYIQRWRDNVGHKANLRRLFAEPGSPLLEEGEFVLSNELHEGAGYFRILRAIASGHRTYGGIRQFSAIDVQRQLEQLQQVDLVERVTPVTEDPNRSKRAKYRIVDNFLAFWFRHVYRHRPDIVRGLGREIIDNTVLPSLSEYMAEPWEEMCREFVRGKAAKGELPVSLSSVGAWWNTDHSVEIDIVGLQGKKVVLAGSVKWARRVSRAELGRLRRQVEALPNRAEHVALTVFGRDRVDAMDALTFTASDLYRA